MKRFLYYLLALGLAAVVAGSIYSVKPAVAQGESPEVYVAEIDGGIDADAAEYLQRVINKAQEDDAAAVAIKLATPGGALDATRNMLGTINNAEELPVITYVTPEGARAASAGTFILMGSDVAAMAPQTNTGAAIPVDGFGRNISGDMGTKTTNDAVALITGVAEAHDRNAEWAESAVREGLAISAQEALDLEVIEYVESGLRGVLEAADGETVQPKGITLNTADAALVQQSRSFEERYGFSPYLAAGVAVLALVALVGTTLAAIRATRQRASTGSEGMVGKIGEVRRRVTNEAPGLVFVHGERWRALPETRKLQPLEPGTEVEVVALRRGSVVVRPAENAN